MDVDVVVVMVALKDLPLIFPVKLYRNKCREIASVDWRWGRFKTFRMKSKKKYINRAHADNRVSSIFQSIVISGVQLKSYGSYSILLITVAKKRDCAVNKVTIKRLYSMQILLLRYQIEN